MHVCVCAHKRQQLLLLGVAVSTVAVLLVALSCCCDGERVSLAVMHNPGVDDKLPRRPCQGLTFLLILIHFMSTGRWLSLKRKWSKYHGHVCTECAVSKH